MSQQNSEAATMELTRNFDLFRTHLIQRRQFLLDPDELQNMGEVAPNPPVKPDRP